MVTALGFILVIMAYGYYINTITEVGFDYEGELNKIKKTTFFIGGIGSGLVVVNSWIITPILRMIGG